MCACTCTKVLRKKGVEPEWEGPGITNTNKGLVYVLENFECAEFKLLLGKCRCVTLHCTYVYVFNIILLCFHRIIGPAVVLAHVNKGWVSHLCAYIYIYMFR